jgi:hypothetical protein
LSLSAKSPVTNPAVEKFAKKSQIFYEMFLEWTIDVRLDSVYLQQTTKNVIF